MTDPSQELLDAAALVRLDQAEAAWKEHEVENPRIAAVKVNAPSIYHASKNVFIEMYLSRMREGLPNP